MDENISSALLENINRKGSNSYYYAHSKKIEGPQWDGNEAPRRLETLNVEKTVLPRVVSIDDYFWSDEKEKVKIYFESAGYSDVADELVEFSHSTSSIDIRFPYTSNVYALVVENLHANIDGASYRRKGDKFIITLLKETPVTWTQLKR